MREQGSSCFLGFHKTICGTSHFLVVAVASEEVQCVEVEVAPSWWLGSDTLRLPWEMPAPAAWVDQ